jgi:sugar lactone lactonase YvrE
MRVKRGSVACLLAANRMRGARVPRTAIASALVGALAACAAPGVPLASLTTPKPLEAGRQHLYWADPTLDWTISQLDPLAATATIGGSNLDGSGMSESAVTGVESPCGVAVDGGHLYWANRRQGGIGRSNLDGNALDNLFVQAAAGSYPCGVAVDANYIYWANHGSTALGTTIGRAALDGTAVNSAFINAALNPCGVAVDADYIYWANEGLSSTGGGSIGRARLDGSGADPAFILMDAWIPCGVAVDGGYVYWANSLAGTIGRARLDGSAKENSFISGARWPCGLAVDATYVYWGNGGAWSGSTGAPAVGRARLDGSAVDQAWLHGMKGICGVAIDPASGDP